MFLAIDTSAGCDVAIVSSEGVILAEYRRDDTRHHAEAIGIGIAHCLETAGVAPSEITEVVTGIGPGPFTGLRVGVAAARAFALANGVPCTSVPSHDAIAIAARDEHPDTVLVVTTDARRRQRAVSRYAPASAAATAEPTLASPDEIEVAEGEVRVDADTVRAAELVQALRARRAEGIPAADDALLYLREPDAVPAAGPKRVTA